MALSLRTGINRARSLLAQGRNAEAAEVAGEAVRSMEERGEVAAAALLAEALTTQGAALARAGQLVEARGLFERAVDLAKRAVSMEEAGHAALTLLEELHGQISEVEMREAYRRADELLSDSHQAETLTRLREAARRILETSRERTSTKAETRFVYAMEETGALLRRALRAAVTNSTVLITGETGTGKEVLARLIHEWSGRAGKFVAVNCRAMNGLLIESQLFGHMKGSFKDALRDHPGAVREAAGGTLFLDEVGELGGTNQARLLRLIERGELHTIGASVPEQIDVRIIAATGYDLREEVASGRFRDDLLYRLQTLNLEILPLRARPGDIPAIAQHFIEEACRQHRKRVTFAPESIEAMRGLPLRGNARELRSLIERILLSAADGSVVYADTVGAVALELAPKASSAAEWDGCSMEEEVLSYEKNLIRIALKAAGGRVTGAARLLGITHQLLSFILNTRHKDLLEARTGARRRRRRSSIAGARNSYNPDKK